MSVFSDQWEKNRKKGRIKYSLQNALIFAIVIILFRNGIHLIDLLQGKEVEVEYTPILISFLWLFLGALLGYYFLIWWWKEKLYLKEKNK